MIVLVACSSEDMSAQVLGFVKSRNLSGNIHLLTHSHLLGAYDATRWFLRSLHPMDYFRTGRLFILIPEKKLSFKLVIFSILLPFSKTIILPDGNYFGVRDFRAWLRVLRNHSGYQGTFSPSSIAPMVIVAAFVVIRTVLFRIRWELGGKKRWKKQQKSFFSSY